MLMVQANTSPQPCSLGMASGAPRPQGRVESKGMACQKEIRTPFGKQGDWMGSRNNRSFQANLSLVFSHGVDNLFRVIELRGSLHPQWIMVICFCKLNRKPKMSHKLLHIVWFSTVTHKADFLGQSQYYHAINNKTKMSIYLFGSMNELTGLQNKGKNIQELHGHGQKWLGRGS